MSTDLPHYDAVIKTPVAAMNLGIVVAGGALVAIDLLSVKHPPQAPAILMAQEVVRQLQGYFNQPQWQFSLSILPQGTAYQQRVWQFMCSIPLGETRRYGDAAKALNSAARAVGGACRRNPVPIVVPCHRIVAANDLGGFDGQRDGAALDFKRWLLNHEKQ